MGRWGILASVAPLVVFAALVREPLAAPSARCIATADGAVELAVRPWQAQTHVTFTDDPSAATIRVQSAAEPDVADFVVVDDVDDADTGCGSSQRRLVGIAPQPLAGAPVIYLSAEPNADFRVFVRSKSFTAREAAALLVAARKVRTPIAGASL